ncbi:hypothetical protein FI667_g6981, partial [Globisporangium splendens]
MSTESFDHGGFWLMVEPAPSLVLFGVAGFAVVVVGYGFIALNATWRRNQSSRDVLASTRLGSASMRVVAVSKAVKSVIDHSLSEIARSTSRTASTQRAVRLIADMTDGNSATRKFVNVGLKVVDFAVQVVLLLHILETGFPVVLVYALTTVIVMDAVACVVMTFGSTGQHDGLVENLVETIFAFLIAIAFPVLVVMHSLATFEFDRKQYAINLDVFPEGEFETLARVIADPVKTSIALKKLTELPDDMFENMSELTFLHFGVHPMMRHLPPLRGLRNLRSLTLAVMMSLEELPPFDDVEKLESLTLTAVSAIDSLPDMAPLTKLNSLVVSYRGTICCNGFLDNHCDLNNPLCQETQLPSKATLAAFARFSNTAYQDIRTALQTEDDFATEENMLQCDGIMYRQCHLPGNRTGMCYNARMMPITCNGNVLPIEMRKRQIQAGIGESCDPKYEAWLGCKEV